MKNKHCSRCLKPFFCTADDKCWCMKMSHDFPIPNKNSADCMCSSCLNELKKTNTDADFYFDSGLMIMTEAYHLKRGYCCKNGCKHCPY